MSSAVLKIIAIVTMVIDHVGYRFFPKYAIFRIIGRLSFPIFCFLVAEGFFHTRNRNKYLLRLSLFGIVSQLPYLMFSYNRFVPKSGDSLNIFFELAAGVVCLMLVEEGKNRNKLLWLPIPIIFLLAEALNFSYGAYGVALIVCLYVFREKKYLQYLSLLVITLLYVYYTNANIQLYAVFACLFMAFYNGKKGRSLPKYFFYVFYPLHLLIIYAISVFINSRAMILLTQ